MQAACRDPEKADPNWFFPERGKLLDKGQALFTCVGCPVIKECGEYAEATDSEGIWAGIDRTK